MNTSCSLSGSQERRRSLSASTADTCGSAASRSERRSPGQHSETSRRGSQKPGDVDPGKLARVNELKAEFLKREPEPEPNVASYWAKYQQIFSAEGLPAAHPRDLKDFANSSVGANPGNMSVFNESWNQLGAEVGAERVRNVVEYLLRGASPVELEDRLSILITDTKSFGMKGFKESLLTKVLCIVYPDSYLTILKYTGEAGKREITRLLWGLELPDPGEGRLDHWTPHPLEQRLAACAPWRRLPAPAACFPIPLVGQGQGLEGTALAGHLAWLGCNGSPDLECPALSGRSAFSGR